MENHQPPLHIQPGVSRRLVAFLVVTHGLGAGVPAQTFHAFGDGAAADHDDFAPVLHQGGQLRTPGGDSGIV